MAAAKPLGLSGPLGSLSTTAPLLKTRNVIRQGEWPCIKLSAVFIAYSHEHRQVLYALMQMAHER